MEHTFTERSIPTTNNNTITKKGNGTANAANDLVLELKKALPCMLALLTYFDSETHYFILLSPLWKNI